MNKKIERISELVKKLNEASRIYYQGEDEIMTNYEYDALYDELAALEKEIGVVLASSPTVNVGYEVLSELPKERHEKPMLSLDKTKDVQALKEWVGVHETILSWKLDVKYTFINKTNRVLKRIKNLINTRHDEFCLI